MAKKKMETSEIREIVGKFGDEAMLLSRIIRAGEVGSIGDLDLNEVDIVMKLTSIARMSSECANHLLMQMKMTEQERQIAADRKRLKD